MTDRRFPSLWSIEEGKTYFVVKDANGQKLGYVYFDDPRSAEKPLTRRSTPDRRQHGEAAGAVGQVLKWTFLPSASVAVNVLPRSFHPVHIARIQTQLFVSVVMRLNKIGPHRL